MSGLAWTLHNLGSHRSPTGASWPWRNRAELGPERHSKEARISGGMQVVQDRSRRADSHKDTGPVGEKDAVRVREGSAILRENAWPDLRRNPGRKRHAGGVTRGQTTEMRGRDELTFFTADWKWKSPASFRSSQIMGIRGTASMAESA